MGESKALKLIYTLFLGVLIALFIGVGINTFYKAPEPPEYPKTIRTFGDEPSQEYMLEQQKYEQEFKKFQELNSKYNRNVSVITLIFSVLLLMLSFLYEKRVQIIANGIMLGGLFTLLYSVIRGFGSENDKYIFVVITVSLIIALYLGFRKFSTNPSTTK